MQPFIFCLLSIQIIPALCTLAAGNFIIFYKPFVEKKDDTPVSQCCSSSSLKLPGPSGRVPPIIRQGPANQTVSRGAAAQLHCRVIGGPSVKISWEKDGERLQGNKPRMTFMDNGTLQITDLKVCVCSWVWVSFVGKGHEKYVFCS